MTCYGISTDPINYLESLIHDLPRIEPQDWANEDRPPLHNASQKLCEGVVFAYLDAFSCFLQILRAVMIRRLEFLESPSGRGAYLRSFVGIYSNALPRINTLLQALFRDMLSQEPALAQALVTQIVASETPGELIEYARQVPVADTAEEAKEHGEVGKQITDSIKRLLRALLLKMPVLKTKKKREEWVDNSLHAVNEVLGVVFRTA